MSLKILSALLLIASLAVANSGDAEPEAIPVFEPAQLEGEKGPYLIGPITRAAWEGFDPDLAAEYDAYEPAPDLVRALSYYEGDATITCVLGTWCHDTQREVPRFWKLLDQAGAPGIELLLIGVGRTDAPEALVWKEDHGVRPGYRDRFDVTLVPTFIVTEDGLEIGRIVETPEVSLEADLAAILGVQGTPAWH